MIVYGDPSFSVAGTELLTGLQARLSDARHSPDLDRLRTLLIHAGQVEQALADADTDEACPAAAAEISDACADAFFAAWQGPASTIRAALQRAGISLQRLVIISNRTVRVKVPEGYAFYALFPEQYAAAALQWNAAHSHAERGPVLVAGVRSIGTSLSALLAAALRSRGWDARRTTLRPTGHPFSREAALSGELIRDAAHGLVVDEGPGLSGSSMAAVAAAMVRAGIPRERITFLPGHTGEPGGCASPKVREWWSRTPRLVTPTAALRWGGGSLTDCLVSRTERLLPGAGGVERVEEFGGGLWRHAACRSEAHWPAVCAPFERPKYRCVLRDGRSVLWKFEGLAIGPGDRSLVEAAVETQAERAAAGWAGAPLDQSLGFVAARWLEGERLTHADADSAMLERLARYVAQAAGPPLTPRQSSESADRLRELLYWNTWELLDEVAAEPLEHLVPPALPANTPSYGDGRLAPHEWLRTLDGRIWKTDMSGHALDHTAVGAQPVWWDVAGAITEWRLGRNQISHFLGALKLMEPALLSYYRAAYAAFRAGQCAMCAGMTGDASERQRLECAAEEYRRALTQALTDLARSR